MKELANCPQQFSSALQVGYTSRGLPCIGIDIGQNFFATVHELILWLTTPIYADLAVPEVWRWIDDQIEVYHLVGKEYQLVGQSVCLPRFPFDRAIATLNNRFDQDETSLVAAFRKSVELN